MARTSGKGYLTRHKKRLFRNQIQIYLRDETFKYMQEHRKRLGLGFSHFIDLAINELMKKPPVQTDKRQYLETMLVDHGKEA